MHNARIEAEGESMRSTRPTASLWGRTRRGRVGTLGRLYVLLRPKAYRLLRPSYAGPDGSVGSLIQRELGSTAVLDALELNDITLLEFAQSPFVNNFLFLPALHIDVFSPLFVLIDIIWQLLGKQELV